MRHHVSSHRTPHQTHIRFLVSKHRINSQDNSRPNIIRRNRKILAKVTHAHTHRIEYCDADAIGIFSAVFHYSHFHGSFRSQIGFHHILKSSRCRNIDGQCLSGTSEFRFWIQQTNRCHFNSIGKSNKKYFSNKSEYSRWKQLARDFCTIQRNYSFAPIDSCAHICHEVAYNLMRWLNGIVAQHILLHFNSARARVRFASHPPVATCKSLQTVAVR